MEFEKYEEFDVELEGDLDNENELEDDLANENDQENTNENADENIDENTSQNMTEFSDSINSKKKFKSYVYHHFTLITNENKYKCNHCG